LEEKLTFPNLNGQIAECIFQPSQRGEDLPHYKVQNDDQEKRENVASLHRKNFSSTAEVEMVSSNTGHNIYRLHCGLGSEHNLKNVIHVMQTDFF